MHLNIMWIENSLLVIFFSSLLSATLNEIFFSRKKWHIHRTGPCYPRELTRKLSKKNISTKIAAARYPRQKLSIYEDGKGLVFFLSFSLAQNFSSRSKKSPAKSWLELLSHREIFSKSYQIKPESDCIYHAPIDLEQQTKCYKSIGK